MTEYVSITAEEAASDPTGVVTYQGGEWAQVEEVSVHGTGPGAWLYVKFVGGGSFAGEPVHYRTFRRAVVAAEVTEQRPMVGMVCVRCGLAPWGYGYCAELCQSCASDDAAEDARLAEEHQCAEAARAEIW